MNFYEASWRPVYEWRAAAAWGVAIPATAMVPFAYPALGGYATWAAAACLVFAAGRGLQAWNRQTKRDRLNEKGLDFVKAPAFVEQTKEFVRKNEIWLGSGFDWSQEQTQHLEDLKRMGIEQLIGKDAERGGAYWMHGLGEVAPLSMPLKHLGGHTLIVGTTGAGKTRMLSLLITQAIIRDEPVIIIDPKGDHDLRLLVKEACVLAGAPEKFQMLHPAFPEQSVRLDPLRNWNRATELASRVAALIPSETGADPFTAFSWKALNDIVQGAILVHQRPNLVNLRRYVEGGIDTLLQRVLRSHFERVLEPDWETRVGPYIKRVKGNLTEAYILFYKEDISRKFPIGEIDGLISGFEHNRDHYSKMVASLIPILTMLTSHPLNELLSPEYDDDDKRPITNIAKVIQNRQVLYVGLDSLPDSKVGSAIGSILMADGTAVAGDRYNYGGNDQVVQFYVDEAAEVINDPTIQMLNKGRGAGFRLTVATQTLADFITRLGSQSKARQVLGNINNILALRVTDNETQKYITEGLPTVKVRSMQSTYRHEIESGGQKQYEAGYSEAEKEEDADLFQPAMLGKLPDLHFMGKLTGGRVVKGMIPIMIPQ